MKRYPIWTYLNISAIDAPLISIAWYLYFTNNKHNSNYSVNYCIILGISVWLGYMADRLFDIRTKKEGQLISFRHKFAKENELKLWNLWFIILIIAVYLSLLTLNSDKIFAGFNLIILILLYNCLNQYFSRKKFPKEICVAALFAYGTLFFIEPRLNIDNFLHFSLICFLNCLILCHKEKDLDKLMCNESWTHSFTNRTIIIIITLLCIYFQITFQDILNPFFVICFLCLLLHTTSHNFSVECFRLILESFYFLVPAFALIP